MKRVDQSSSVVAEGLGKRYRSGVWGLRDASFELRPHQVTALLGHNGAGKSTALNLLGGLLRPTEGRVEVHSANGAVGWCPQVDIIDWSLAVLENVCLIARLTGMSRTAALEQAGLALRVTALTDCVDREAQELSGGQLRRMQIARALVGEPDVLFLDEPASGLDPEGTDVLFRDLERRAEQGALVLISSHDLHAIERHTDVVLLLADGRVVVHQPLTDFVAGSTGLREAYLAKRG